VSSFQSILFSGKLIWELTAFSRRISVILLQLRFLRGCQNGWHSMYGWKMERGSNIECELAPSIQFCQLNLSVHIIRT